MTLNREEYISKFPEKIQNLLGPEAEKKQKMMLADGLIPLPPKQWVPVLAFLTYEPDVDISKSAIKNLQELPTSIALTIAQDPTSFALSLDQLAKRRSTDEEIIEKILLNPSTHDDTLIELARSISQKNATILTNNQVRLMKNPKIAETIRLNSHALKSDLEKMVSFLRVNGVALEGENADLTMEEIELILSSPDSETMKSLPDTLVKDTPDDEVGEKEKLSMYQYVQTLRTGEKIKLALKGNKEARNLMIKESNKIVCTAVIKNPRITDGEVLAICLNRSINDDIIRIISEKKDWIKNYSVQHALAAHPKTPYLTAVRFTRNLNVSDLKRLAKNKNAPAQIQKLAKQMFQTKV
ncbi:MAG: hypothetical protein R3A11_03105 [Bdellovibrionota bacterium]